MKEGRGGKLARSCWEEMKERSKAGKVGSKWEEERKSYIEDRGLGLKEWKRKREQDEEWGGMCIKEGKERDRKERWERIKNSKVNI